MILTNYKQKCRQPGGQICLSITNFGSWPGVFTFARASAIDHSAAAAAAKLGPQARGQSGLLQGPGRASWAGRLRDATRRSARPESCNLRRPLTTATLPLCKPEQPNVNHQSYSKRASRRMMMSYANEPPGRATWPAESGRFGLSSLPVVVVCSLPLGWTARLLLIDGQTRPRLAGRRRQQVSKGGCRVLFCSQAAAAAN